VLSFRPVLFKETMPAAAVENANENEGEEEEAGQLFVAVKDWEYSDTLTLHIPLVADERQRPRALFQQIECGMAFLCLLYYLN
jgi:hypothetical protein